MISSADLVRKTFFSYLRQSIREINKSPRSSRRHPLTTNLVQSYEEIMIIIYIYIYIYMYCFFFNSIILAHTDY